MQNHYEMFNLLELQLAIRIRIAINLELSLEFGDIFNSHSHKSVLAAIHSREVPFGHVVLGCSRF